VGRPECLCPAVAETTFKVHSRLSEVTEFDRLRSNAPFPASDSYGPIFSRFAEILDENRKFFVSPVFNTLGLRGVNFLCSLQHKFKLFDVELPKLARKPTMGRKFGG